MALPAQSAPFSEDEFNRLEDLLASDIFSGDAMALDELQGFLCAILSGPELIPPSEWLPAQSVGMKPEELERLLREFRTPN